MPAGATANYPCQIHVSQPEEFLVIAPVYVDDGGLRQLTIEVVGRGRSGGSNDTKPK